MTSSEFRTLLDALADGWRRRDYTAVASQFAPDVQYGDPLRYHLEGRPALEAFFSADEGFEQHVWWHLVLFDEAQQIGVVEYTYEGTHRYHGVALARIHAGLITHWREYQHTYPRDWRSFVGTTAFPEQV